jgi:hypothetical protein
MDLVAEYAHAYGGAPRPDQTWHEVVALALRASRFDARLRMAVRDGTILAQPAGEKYDALQQIQRARVSRMAYPFDED